jgi:hypothetical protein
MMAELVVVLLSKSVVVFSTFRRQVSCGRLKVETRTDDEKRIVLSSKSVKGDPFAKKELFNALTSLVLRANDEKAPVLPDSFLEDPLKVQTNLSDLIMTGGN